MGATTGISWTDATWNPIRGCSRVSPGCVNCYAEVVAARFSGPGQPYEGLATTVNGHARWTNTVAFIEKHLHDPLRWQKPRRIFVNSMSDLFHEALEERHIAEIFAVMAAATRHRFQVLTKRPARARELLGDEGFERTVRAAVLMDYADEWPGWPLPNVWLGTSVEDQQRATERIPHLLATPAAVRFISAEPLLEALTLDMLACPLGHVCDPYGWPYDRTIASPGALNALTGEWWPAVGNVDEEIAGRVAGLNHLDWVIVGGESGPGFRPMDLAWAASLRDQCANAGVAFFFKQVSAPRSGQGADALGALHHQFPGEDHAEAR